MVRVFANGPEFNLRMIHTKDSKKWYVMPPCLPLSFIISYLPNPSARAGYDTRSIFKRSLTGLNSEFSFS